MWTAPCGTPQDVVADAWNQIMEKETDMTPSLTGTVLKGLFGRLLPDIAAVIFHEYPKERQLELIEGRRAKEQEALLATPVPVYPGPVDALLFFPDITRFIS